MDTNYKDIKLKKYNEFISVVERLGFMTLSNNCIGFPNLESMTEEDQWHTDLPSDPWRWRVNIEKDKKAAYGKLFDKKPGYISLEWYPKFFAARRKRRSFLDMYEDGLMSIYAKQIYELFVETWAKEIVILSDNINPEDAKKEILLRIEEIVPDAQQKKVNRFLGI